MKFNLENQVLDTSPELKAKYGEVFTPYGLINEMLDLLPRNIWKQELKWLDPACGTGYFFHVIFNRLLDANSKITAFDNGVERTREKIQSMLTACEINPDNIRILKKDFPNLTIWNDFLSMKETQFDIIVGNPPYNSRGLKKVPTRVGLKRNDGETVWTQFVRKSLDMLRDDGYLCMIIPSIWMKPDKAGIYELLTQYKMRIKCMTNTETMRVFHNQAQTPTSVVCLQKTKGNIELWDEGRWITYSNEWITNKQAIPTRYAGIAQWSRCLQTAFSRNSIARDIIAKSEGRKGIPRHGSLGSLEHRIIKTGMPSKFVDISKTKDEIHIYPNIQSCIVKERPIWTIEYSDKPCKWRGIRKIVLAHKMYGYAQIDASGEYGISRRDNYVMLFDKNTPQIELERWKALFNTRYCRAIFNCAKYRMRYLEKYAFEFIPDFSRLPCWTDKTPEQINDQWLMDTFCMPKQLQKQLENIKLTSYD